MTNWVAWMIIGGGVAAYLILKRFAFIPAAKARGLLKAGAIVIDVRSREEFQERHLPGALNIPLNELAAEISRTAPEKSKVLLLHCLSGGRSGAAQLNLKRMGYGNTFNLGSYARAKRIVGA